MPVSWLLSFKLVPHPWMDWWGGPNVQAQSLWPVLEESKEKLFPQRSPFICPKLCCIAFSDLPYVIAYHSICHTESCLHPTSEMCSGHWVLHLSTVLHHVEYMIEKNKYMSGWTTTPWIYDKKREKGAIKEVRTLRRKERSGMPPACSFSWTDVFATVTQQILTKFMA